MRDTKFSLGVLEMLRQVKDPRLNRQKLHCLFDVLAISLLASLCGANSFVQMEDYGKSNEAWLKTFLSLENGIPSHDTFNRVFSLLDPKGFSSCLLEVVSAVSRKGSVGETLALDGKTLRRSFDKAKKKSPLHLVSAFATQTHLLLGQVKTHEKSNEIRAMPELLARLDIAGKVVTIDAMGCQKEIAKQIKEQKGEYVLAVKGNQGALLDEVQTLFRYEKQRKHKKALVYTEVDKAHGRIETRRCSVLPCPATLPSKACWAGIQSLIEVHSTRELGEKTTQETRYYISSLQPDPNRLLTLIRGHWGIENVLHWGLDVAFLEDLCRVRKKTLQKI